MHFYYENNGFSAVQINTLLVSSVGQAARLGLEQTQIKRFIQKLAFDIMSSMEQYKSFVMYGNCDPRQVHIFVSDFYNIKHLLWEFFSEICG